MDSTSAPDGSESGRRGDFRGHGDSPRPGEPGRRPRSRQRTILRWIAAAIVSLVAAWLVVATWAFVFPAEDAPEPVDAVVVLGGRGGNAVIDAGLDLARSGYSSQVVLSTAFGGNTRPENLCARPDGMDGGAIAVDCMDPDPPDTRGEARALAALVDERGWDSVLVVTSTYHVTRARVILDRCLPGDVLMQGVETADVSEWVYQYAYQSAAFVKVVADPGC